MAVFWAPSPCTLISDVEKESSRTDSGVVAPVSVAPQRIPPNGGVPYAGGEVEQGVLPFCRVERGVASVWGWDNRSHRRCNEKQASTKTTEDSEGITLWR